MYVVLYCTIIYTCICACMYMYSYLRSYCSALYPLCGCIVRSFIATCHNICNLLTVFALIKLCVMPTHILNSEKEWDGKGLND